MLCVLPTAADRYLTAVQDYLADVLAPSAAAPQQHAGDPQVTASSTAARAHAALLQQLAARTPRLLNGVQLFSVVEACRLLPLGVEWCARVCVCVCALGRGRRARVGPRCLQAKCAPTGTTPTMRCCAVLCRAAAAHHALPAWTSCCCCGR